MYTVYRSTSNDVAAGVIARRTVSLSVIGFESERTIVTESGGYCGTATSVKGTVIPTGLAPPDAADTRDQSIKILFF
jgi:hypothetical protein